MAILIMINKFPQFLQHLVLEYNVPFKDIISLSQTCKDLHQWFIESFRAYNTIYKYEISKTNMLNENDLYTNITERRLFQIIYNLHKNKMSFNEAMSKSIIPILVLLSRENILP